MTARLRCAIYTRKSSEEGLEQDFNSLHAQREACEAYIKSQVGEGWVALPQAYDDGGFSGGSLERPGLAKLLDDIAFGRVDVVVVYKVDRLTRSLADFAKIVEQFDARGVSFVSVTQAFNTTSSMGRLTLNVLLSFAQFEREVTGERIRDKIAASKAKGIWMGGMPPLGYDIDSRKLVINEAEAAVVRRIYQRYLEVGSAYDLVAELQRDGVRFKAWTTRGGKPMGGCVLHRGAIFHILSSRVYLGEIVHKDKVYPGQHPAIISAEMFEAVAAKRKTKSVDRAERKSRVAKGALTGRLFDQEGRPFIPAFGYGKGGQAYRYYVNADLQIGRARVLDDGTIRRVSAPAVEGFLVQQIVRLSGCELTADRLSTVLQRGELRQTETHLVLDLEKLLPGQHPDLSVTAIRRRLATNEQMVIEPGDGSAIRVVLPLRLQLRGGRKWGAGIGAAKALISRPLVQALRRAHADLADKRASPITDPQAMVEAVAPLTHHARQMGRLAFLAPELQREVLVGGHMAQANLGALFAGQMPLAWADQKAWLRSLI